VAGPLPSIDRYTVEAELGSGGFGAVYRARHVVLGRPVALKVLHPSRASDVEVVQRFLREARAIAGLGSPNIVQVLDADVASDGRAFLAMELLEGEDLAHRLGRGRMPKHEAMRIARDVLAALHVAHGQGVVHRDLKPGNVFLARQPSGETIAKVLDFGISKVRTESPADELTRTGTILGTPQYMAPEQFKSSKDVDARADLYSVGVLLYEALAGRLPYGGTTLHAIIAAKLTETPPPIGQAAPDVPQAVADVVMRALANEPEHRYQSAAEMDAAIAAVEARVSAPGVTMSGKSTSVRPAPIASVPPSRDAPAPPGRAGRIVGWVLGIGAAMVMAGVLIAALLVLGAVVGWRRFAAPAPAIPPAPVTSAPLPTVAAPVPALVPVPDSRPPPTAAPSADGVHLTVTSLGGLADEDALRELGARASPALSACRTATAYHESIQFTVMAPTGRLQTPTITTTPGPTHDCIARAIVAASPVRGTPMGIAIYDVALDPR
jgi:serine/threonine-protein kinase